MQSLHAGPMDSPEGPAHEKAQLDPSSLPVGDKSGHELAGSTEKQDSAVRTREAQRRPQTE